MGEGVLLFLEKTFVVKTSVLGVAVVEVMIIHSEQAPVEEISSQGFVKFDKPVVTTPKITILEGNYRL